MKVIFEGVKRYAEYKIEKSEITNLTKVIEDDTRLDDHISYKLKDGEDNVLSAGILEIFYGSKKELNDGEEYAFSLTKEQSDFMKKNMRKNINLFMFVYQTEGRDIFDYVTTDQLMYLINNTYDYNANRCVVKCKRYGT